MLLHSYLHRRTKAQWLIIRLPPISHKLCSTTPLITGIVVLRSIPTTVQGVVQRTINSILVYYGMLKDLLFNTCPFFSYFLFFMNFFLFHKLWKNALFTKSWWLILVSKQCGNLMIILALRIYVKPKGK